MKKILIDPADFHEIISFCEAVPVPWGMVKKAARLQQIFSGVQLADVSITEVEEKGAPK